MHFSAISRYFLEATIGLENAPSSRSLIFTARCRTRDSAAFAGCRAALGASVCSHLLWLLKIRTGTMSSAPTSNSHLNIVESSKSSSAVATSIANRAFIEISYCKIHLNAQYSNLESEQYISSVMDPELMINFCPRDYPGIYAVKNSKFEHFNGRIFIKILKAILVYLLLRVCNVIATASEDVTRAQRCIR